MSESRQTLDLDYEEGKQVCGNFRESPKEIHSERICSADTQSGHRGYEHEKERVTHLDGTYSYDYLCPEGGDDG